MDGERGVVAVGSSFDVLRSSLKWIVVIVFGGGIGF